MLPPLKQSYDEYMPRFLSVSVIIFLTLSFAATESLAQQPASRTAPANTAATKQDALIDALRSYPFGEVYTEDISASNSITFAGKKSEGSDRVTPVTPLRNIVNLDQAAIPLLISHLTDQRPTQALYRQQAVPVAYLALDLLLHLSDLNDERVVIPGCEQHGLGDCMQPEFYFSPDASDPNTFAAVQKAWAEQNKQQPIKFVYPSWWN